MRVDRLGVRGKPEFFECTVNAGFSAVPRRGRNGGRPRCSLKKQGEIKIQVEEGTQNPRENLLGGSWSFWRLSKGTIT